jgi:hypothetical protein
MAVLPGWDNLRNSINRKVTMNNFLPCLSGVILPQTNYGIPAGIGSGTG